MLYAGNDRRLSEEELKEKVYMDYQNHVLNKIPDGHYKKTVKSNKVVSFVLLHSGENFPEVVDLLNETPEHLKAENDNQDTIHYISRGCPESVWLA